MLSEPNIIFPIICWDKTPKHCQRFHRNPLFHPVTLCKTLFRRTGCPIAWQPNPLTSCSSISASGQYHSLLLSLPSLICLSSPQWLSIIICLHPRLTVSFSTDQHKACSYRQSLSEGVCECFFSVLWCVHLCMGQVLGPSRFPLQHHPRSSQSTWHPNSITLQ